MSGSNNAPHTQSIDWLFAQLPGDPLGHSVSTPITQAGSSVQDVGVVGIKPLPPSLPPRAWPKPPPNIEGCSDVRAAQEWLQAERKQLEDYTHKQFNTIQQQHQALLAKHFRSEESLALRSQEMNREMQFLASQTETLQKRARELSEREATLAEQLEKLAQAQEELLRIQQSDKNVARETETQRETVEKLRAETAELQIMDKASRAEFDLFEENLKDRQRAWEQKHAEIKTRLEEMERRYEELEKAEEDARRRLSEIDEMEDRVREEIEEEERRQIEERRSLENLWRSQRPARSSRSDIQLRELVAKHLPPRTS